MTKEEAVEAIRILEAYRDGKSIQILVGEAWMDEPNPGFNFYNQYRVKPVPREFWVNIYAGDRHKATRAHETRGMADEMAYPERIECIHVREVI